MTSILNTNTDTTKPVVKKSYTKHHNFDNVYKNNPDLFLDEEEREEKEYQLKHNSYENFQQKKKFTIPVSKFQPEQILYHGRKKCKIINIIDNGKNEEPSYRVCEVEEKKNIQCDKLYKLLTSRKEPDYNKRLYSKYDENNKLKINDTVYHGKLDCSTTNPLPTTLPIENHDLWTIFNINEDGTFDIMIDRMDEDKKQIIFANEDELSLEPVEYINAMYFHGLNNGYDSE